MHVQVPTRVSYILGFKGLRQVLEARYDTQDSPLVGISVAVAPGLAMTPLSSILEVKMCKSAVSCALTRKTGFECGQSQSRAVA